ncbi:MAG: four-carbon acid sugar kinase family protein, partial [Actinomycetota bacterium]|nr:four-carbon acid sugar kinase family protein [Actinomycetota bacterium]
MPVLGCIADDITGATDLASALVERGVPTALVFGAPQGTVEIAQTAAIVVALKIRSAPAVDARRLATTSARWLQESGVSRLYVKYCSTFDSTPAGNIGPITDAVLALTGASIALHSP